MMLDAELAYRRAALEFRAQACRFLLQIGGPDRNVRVEHLVDFARDSCGITIVADNLAAFRGAMNFELESALAELQASGGTEDIDV